MHRDLVERAMAGDREAFTELTRHSIGRLYAIARLILRDQGRAEDATLAFNYVVTDPNGSNPVDVPSPMLLPGLPGVWAPDGSRLLGLHKTAPGAVELYQVDPAGLAEPVVIPIDTDWVNVSWQRVAP